ncbi:hypothetical protein EGW08_013416 [Elysia chlorotica]|uniref:PDZ domain-containing protein n=1 Tax=Elysia chlorotica TaxID=188477 RepID=A0A3S1BEC6_ELYCH|nr:hypothetical protein EGW08_013416 [Elysia chlorotica]
MPSTSASGEFSANTIRVKLVKQSYGGLGFLVKQRTLKPFVLVASIVKGGVAEESGLVQIGDIILRINDIDLTDMSYQSAIEVLKAVPIDTHVVLLLRGPEGYTTFLQTTFGENGQPRTIRVTKPVHESLMGRLKKTFTGSSSPMSPVKGIKRLCNGEVGLKDQPGDAYDTDADSTGGVDGGRGHGDGEGGANYPVMAVEELGAGRDGDGSGFSKVYNGNGGIVGVDIGGKIAGGGNNNTITADMPNGDVAKAKASKFAFINEGRVESEEETVLDNGAVGSPKIVLTSPKNRKDSQARDEADGAGPMGRGQVQMVNVSPCRGRQRKFSQKKAIEILQDEDEITVVVRGDVSVLSEESSTDPNSPRKFIISTGNKHRYNYNSPTNSNTNSNGNGNESGDDLGSVGSASLGSLVNCPAGSGGGVA